MSFIQKIEDMLSTLSRYSVSKDFPDYSDLHSTISLTQADQHRHPELSFPYIALTKQGYYLSVMEIMGSFQEFDESAQGGENSLATYIDDLTMALSSALRRPGHKISVVLERDPERGKREISKMLKPQYDSVRRLGIRMNDILDGKVATLSPWLVSEHCWISVWSSPQLTSKHEQQDYRNEQIQIKKGAPDVRFGQEIWEPLFSSLKIRHDAFLDTLTTALSADKQGQLVQLLDVPRICHTLRSQVERYDVSPDWIPVLPETAKPAGMSHDGDISALLAPPLNFQVFSSDAPTEGNLVQAGGLWHGTVSVTLPPQQPRTMNALISAIPRVVPWRIRMDLMPGGMETLRTSELLTTFGRFIESIRPLNDAIVALKKTDRNEPVCVMTIVASTWGKTREECTRNLMLLRAAIEGWGICEATTTFGDPRRGWVNTLLAASCGSGPNMLFPPLSHALGMMPFNRPASAWNDEGQIMFHNPDGKPFPAGLATFRQTKFTEIAAGEPGTGKSVTINALGSAMISSARQRLPWYAMIDKGYSAMGLIQLIRDGLPPDRKNEAVGIILQNSEEYCRNPFDILYGARVPITPEREFMINLLYALCIDPARSDAPSPADTRQIITRIIDDAFAATAEKAPRIYAPGVLTDVDEALQAQGLAERYSAEWWEDCPWYDVRDMLHDAGCISAAQSAHYQAVPELSDMQYWLNTADIKSAFGSVQRDGSQEPLLDYISRCLTLARSEYKMLAGRTRFAINPETRVIAVDLNRVAGDSSPAGRLKTGIMYLFAGQIAAGDFLLPQYQDEIERVLPAAYQAMMQERVDQLDQEIKTKLYDELHNAKGISFIMQSLETQDREMRKFGIRTVLSSQYLGDFPEAILKSANTLWLMKIRPEDAPLLREHFGVPDVTVKKFLRHTGGAASDGSGTTFLGVFRTKEGVLARILKNTLGSRELWALNSSPQDSALRRLLNEDVGSDNARRILSENFPHGSAEKLIEYRRKQAGEKDASTITRDLARELINSQGYRL